MEKLKSNVSKNLQSFPACAPNNQKHIPVAFHPSEHLGFTHLKQPSDL
jgi:hypothetical protein